MLGRYARFLDHLAVKNVAQDAPLRGGSNLQDKNDGKLTSLLFYFHLCDYSSLLKFAYLN